jgi:quercetin dioxygenase-like cupin family protein
MSHDKHVVDAAVAEAQNLAAEREEASAAPQDGFAAERRGEGASAEDLGAVAGLLRPASPPAALRSRLLASIQQGRFARYRKIVATLLEVDEVQATELLEGIDEPANFEPSDAPGVTLYHLEGGPSVENAITGFVKVERGGMFPPHEHAGQEYVVILQGSCRDTSTGEVVRPGDLAMMAPGGSHALVVEPGPALIYLAVVFTGIRIGERLYGPQDPDM